jgi:DNA invertase Pin-like site-specific DNA recombinase
MNRKGRPIGSHTLSFEQIDTIINMTLESKKDISISRTIIANKADCSKMTVYRIQKQFGLI